MSTFRKISEDERYRGWRFGVAVTRYRAPDGSEFDREIVRHPGAVAVVPLHADGTVTLVRQFRASLEVELLELPAGIRDVEGEPDATTAARELMEEAGLAAGQLVRLLEFHNSPGFCDESVAVFLATELTEVDHDRQGIEEQSMTLERVSMVEALMWIDEGRITDAKTIIGLQCVARRA